MLILTGCSTTMGIGAINKFYCGTKTEPGAYVPVEWSKRDTAETVAQVKANNAVYDAVCK